MANTPDQFRDRNISASIFKNEADGQNGTFVYVTTQLQTYRKDPETQEDVRESINCNRRELAELIRLGNRLYDDIDAHDAPDHKSQHQYARSGPSIDVTAQLNSDANDWHITASRAYVDDKSGNTVTQSLTLNLDELDSLLEVAAAAKSHASVRALTQSETQQASHPQPEKISVRANSNGQGRRISR